MGNSMYHYWKSQPEVLRQILEQRKSQTEEFVKLFCAVNPDKLYLIGSGTSLNAGACRRRIYGDNIGCGRMRGTLFTHPAAAGRTAHGGVYLAGGLVDQHAAGDGTACRLPVHQYHRGGGM